MHALVEILCALVVASYSPQLARAVKSSSQRQTLLRGSPFPTATTATQETAPIHVNWEHIARRDNNLEDNHAATAAGATPTPKKVLALIKKHALHIALHRKEAAGAAAQEWAKKAKRKRTMGTTMKTRSEQYLGGDAAAEAAKANAAKAQAEEVVDMLFNLHDLVKEKGEQLDTDLTGMAHALKKYVKAGGKGAESADAVKTLEMNLIRLLG